MQRKMYRIELIVSDTIINELVILAALSNGGNYISLKEIAAVAKTNYIRYYGSGKDISINPIGEHCLTIDRGTQNLLVLTEVEIYALDVPTLDRQLEGITDPKNAEALN